MFFHDLACEVTSQKNKLWTEKSKVGKKEKKRVKSKETQSNENEISVKKNQLKAL